MTNNEEAVERLEYIKTHDTDPEDYEVFDLAIKALETQLTCEWIYHEEWENEGGCGYECPRCGRAYDYDMNFCGYCGTRMTGVKNESEEAC